MVVADDMPENQIEMFNKCHCLMKYYPYFDESITITKMIIKDNLIVLKSLSKNFFGSLQLLKDSLTKEDPETIMKIDLLVKDPNMNLFVPNN
jgi:hypothetical protein